MPARNPDANASAAVYKHSTMFSIKSLESA